MPVGGLLHHKLLSPASDCLRLVLNQQAQLPTLKSRNWTTNSSSTHQPTAALQIDQSLYHTCKLCRQPSFTACSARESTTTEITGPKLIGYTGTMVQLYKKFKNVSCEYNRLDGWNPTMQAAWYINRGRIIWFLWFKHPIWLLILSFTQNVIKLNHADMIGD